MSTRSTDRNLLLGLLALQNNFINREQLLTGFSVWVLNKQQALYDILRQQGALDAETRALLQALAAKHLALHGGERGKSAELQIAASAGTGRAAHRCKHC